MNEREQKIDSITSAVVAELAEHAKTTAHHQQCWKRHAYCLAEVIQGILHEDVR